MSTCPKGMIRRKAYTRKSGVRVRSTCIRDLGKPGKGKKLFTLKRGSLGKFNYGLTKKQSKRRGSLKKANSKMTRGQLVKKLNALRILHRNTNPIYAKRAEKDMKWVQKNL